MSYGLQGVIFLDPFSQLDAGDLGQLDVHDDQVRVVAARHLEPFHAFARLQDAVAANLEQFVKKFHVQFVVFDNEDGLGLGLLPRGPAAGSQFVLLGHLSSQMHMAALAPRLASRAGVSYCSSSEMRY